MHLYDPFGFIREERRRRQRRYLIKFAVVGIALCALCMAGIVALSLAQ